MSTAELVAEIKALPPQERDKVLGMLSCSSESRGEDRLFDDFTRIGLAAGVADVSFAEPVQCEAIEHG